MQCWQCGARLRETAMLCQYCGAHQTGQGPALPPPEAPRDPGVYVPGRRDAPASPPPSPPKRKRRLLSYAEPPQSPLAEDSAEAPAAHPMPRGAPPTPADNPREWNQQWDDAPPPARTPARDARRTPARDVRPSRPARGGRDEGDVPPRGRRADDPPPPGDWDVPRPPARRQAEEDWEPPRPPSAREAWRAPEDERYAPPAYEDDSAEWRGAADEWRGGGRADPRGRGARPPSRPTSRGRDAWPEEDARGYGGHAEYGGYGREEGWSEEGPAWRPGQAYDGLPALPEDSLEVPQPARRAPPSTPARRQRTPEAQGWGDFPPAPRRGSGSRSSGRGGGRRPRRRRGTLPLVLVLLAALVAGGVLLAPRVLQTLRGGASTVPTCATQVPAPSQGTPAAPPQVGANMQPYTSQRSRYSLAYPTGWNAASDAHTMLEQYDYLDYFSTADGKAQLRVEQAGAFACYTDVEILNGLVATAKQGGNTFTEVTGTPQTQTVGGSVWQRREYTVRTADGLLREVLYATHIQGRGYALVLLAPDADFAKVSTDAFAPMLQSFRFAR